MKLSVHLGLLAAVALIPVVVFSNLALGMLRDAHRDTAVRGIRETGRATSLVIDREIYGAQTALRALATSSSLSNGDLESFYRRARLARSGTDTWVILYEPNGQQLLNTRLPFGSALPISSRPEQIAALLRKNKPSVSELNRGTSPQRYTLSVDIPVVLDNGKRYVLSQLFFPEYFKIAFSDQDIPSSWITGIFDQHGIAIARTHRDAEFVGKPAKPDTLAAILAGPDVTLKHATRDGVEVYDTITHSRLSGLTVVTGAPVAEIDGSARAATYVAVAGLLAALALAVAAAAFVGRRLVRSINAASAAAGALGSGKAPPPLPGSGVDVIDKLHHAIGAAAQVLANERQAREAAEAERARLLESEQAARALAEAQNQAKDQFLAMLGHELRNPLNAISGAIAVIDLPAASAEAQLRARGIVRRQSEHLAHIVDDLLDLSRVMSGKILLDLRPIDLAALVRASVETLYATGRAQPQRLTLSAQPVWVQADSTRLEQIVTNLIDNALKYTPEGGSIAVAVGPDGADALVTVRDSGIGIAPALLPLVFDVFVQGDSSLDRAKGGMGIGLALVQRLVALHGGSVAADSAGAGAGSVFSVRLPARLQQAAPALAAARPSTAGASRILLIDDQADGLEMMALLLGACGHDVLQASNGYDGLELARAERPDVAVIDIGLPGMSGYELARRLRSDPATQHMHLIALTGYGLEEDRQRALAAGFNLHFAKPIKAEDLHAALSA